jgi:hypothetical protein
LLVIHGLWSATDRLLLWGEDSTLPANPPRRPGRRPRVQAHPYAPTTDALVGALGGGANKAAAVSVVLRLPLLEGSPVPSPELVREEPPAPGRAPADVADWLVPALAYEPDDAAIALLAAVSDQRDPDRRSCAALRGCGRRTRYVPIEGRRSGQ